MRCGVRARLEALSGIGASSDGGSSRPDRPLDVRPVLQRAAELQAAVEDIGED